MDAVSLEPKNQRVQNYINFIHQKKFTKHRLPSIENQQNEQ